ncbi:hypothetical protein BJ875DRAFT_171607 [Amylocarpus encephaloides]|uniref:Uncharacterized protein n=1 Tax=Amylocarpus encephaloides TaxID=45428 RepID=A0A9P8C2A4_9HELO|nr:hypothetical protein BJ875DRAFT_171607 [Amylocarpus encephaloides]
MSNLKGLSDVASVIVSYNSFAVAFQSWLRMTRERWDNEENQQLDRSLIAGGSEIQYEYDDSLARLGPRFSSGDGISSSQLEHCLAQLKQIGLVLATESNFPEFTTLPSLPYVLSVSENTRVTVINILRDLYERMNFSGPLPQSFVSPHHRSQIRGSVASETQRDLVRRRPR